jgi:hypothetical protein
MNIWLSVLAFALAVFSAVALYAASPHCMWSALRGRWRFARSAGLLLALLALIVWISVLGMAVGLCAMLLSWMSALVAQPCLALLTGTPAGDASVIGRGQ